MLIFKTLLFPVRYFRYSTLLLTIFFVAVTSGVYGQMTQYCIGDAGNQLAEKIRYIPADGSTIIAGYSYDIVGGGATNCQGIIMKITSAGSIAWQKTFGVPARNNMIMDMIITQDNNIVVVGTVGGTGAIYSDNTAAILKYNSADGSLMWQTCLRDVVTTTGGEIFRGVTELRDGTNRLVVVGSHNYTGPGADAMICVFQSTGSLIYNDVYRVASGDDLISVITSADGASVYTCGEFVGDYKDGRVMSYTPGTTTGTINWAKYFDFYLLGTLQNNFFTNIYLSGTKLIVSGESIFDYTYTGGLAHSVLTLNAADGSGAQLYTIQNSATPYANSAEIAVIDADHIFAVQSPGSSYADPTLFTPGVTDNTVITEITSLSGHTTNPPVRLTSSDVGQHSILDLQVNGSTLNMAGATNVTSGFGNNDVYFVSTGFGLASSNATCDTIHDVISIVNTPFTSTPPSFDTIHFTPVYSTVDTGTTHYSIKAICGDNMPVTCNTLSMPDTLHLCVGDTATVHAVLTGSDSVLNYTWSPATGLSSTTILDPVITATTSGWYYLTVNSLYPTNLVVNGDFSAGNTGFTSSYSYVSGAGSLVPESVYAIDTDPWPDHPAAVHFGDHTTGTGNMMSINGASSPISVWCETIPVTPNTNYDFSAWVANWSSADVGAGVPLLQFQINGVLIGTPDAITSAPGVWTNFFATWNSGISTTASICIYDETTAADGNDFALDDISFTQICVATDSFYMALNAPDTTYGHRDTSVCATVGTMTLTAPGGYAGHVWYNGDTTRTVVVTGSGNYWVVDSNACSIFIDTFHVTFTIPDTTTTHVDTAICATLGSLTLTAPSGYTTPVWSTGATTTTIVVSAPGPYWVLSTANCTTSVDTFDVTFTVPDTATTHVLDTVCASLGSLTLSAPAGFVSPVWSTGATTSTIVVTAAGSYWVLYTSNCATSVDTFDVFFKASPVITLGNDTAFCQGDSVILMSVQPAGDTYLWSTGATGDSIHVSVSGTYSLTVSNGCPATASITITVSPHPLVNLGPDVRECDGQAVVLQSSYTYVSPTYLWSNATSGATTTVTATGTYWLQVTVDGCSGADTVNVTILYDTLTLFNHDTAICKGNAVQVLTTGTALQTYLWTPTAGIAFPTSGSPLITPDTSATYTLTVYYPGCPNLVDSFHIDVQPVPQVYLGGNRQVCEYDTLHITASVNPTWYMGYTYAWSPAVSLDNSGTATVVFTAGDSTNIILTVTTPAGCIGVDSAEIIVHPGNFVNFDSSFAVCPGDSVQLFPVANPGPATYVWHPAMYLTDSTSSAPWVHPITSQYYWAVATNQYGCLDTVSANITVRSNAVLYLPDSITLYPGESYQLSPQTNCTSFEWTPPGGLSDAYISNPVATPEISTKYVVYGYTEWGCKTKDSINIYVDAESLIALPNAFTPGNGVNTLFKVLLRGEATLNYFRIYNRWGNLVFTTSDISAGWDGTFHGQPQPYDVYVYEIEAVTSTGTVFHKAGNVTLIR